MGFYISRQNLNLPVICSTHADLGIRTHAILKSLLSSHKILITGQGFSEWPGSEFPRLREWNKLQADLNFGGKYKSP